MSVRGAFNIPERGIVIYGKFKGIMPFVANCRFVDIDSGTTKITAWVKGIAYDKKLVKGLSTSEPIECEMLLSIEQPSVDEKEFFNTILLDSITTVKFDIVE